MELWVFQKGKQNDSGAATIPAMPTSRLGAMLSALALIASVTAYISSFFAPPADKLLPWYVLLFAGAFVNTLVIYFIELP
jgi:hypothetical protein